MRFVKQRRYPFEITDRKRQFLANKLWVGRLVPAAVVEAEVDAIMADRAARWARAEAEDRAKRAEDWRWARQRYFALSDNERGVVRAYWKNRRWGPIDATHLAMLIADLDAGKLTLDALAAKTATDVADTARFPTDRLSPEERRARSTAR